MTWESFFLLLAAATLLIAAKRVREEIPALSEERPARWLRWDTVMSYGLNGDNLEVFFLGLKEGEGLWSYGFQDGRYFEEDVQRVETFVHYGQERRIVFLALKDVWGDWVQDTLWPEVAIRHALRLQQA